MNNLKAPIVISLAALVLATSGSGALAALDKTGVQQAIKGAKLWSDAHEVNVVCDGDHILVATYRDRREVERDCKIDAVVLTRKIMSLDQGVSRVTVRFYELLHPHVYRQIEVRQSDIAAFGTGLIKDDKLLAGIGITHGSDVPKVAPGPFAEERGAIKQHIAELQNKGVGVAAYTRLFSEIEELAPQAQSQPAEATMDKLRASLNALLSKLDEQESALRHLHPPAAGRPATPVRTVAAAPSPASVGNQTAGDGYTRVEKLGRFTPSDGPFLLDRLRIARKLAEMDNRKALLQAIIDVWKRMDASANRKDTPAVKADVGYLEHQLSLPPVSDQDRASTTLIQSK